MENDPSPYLALFLYSLLILVAALAVAFLPAARGARRAGGRPVAGTLARTRSPGPAGAGAGAEGPARPAGRWDLPDTALAVGLVVSLLGIALSFLVPWTAFERSLGALGPLGLVVFLAFPTLGVLYAFGRGGLD